MIAATMRRSLLVLVLLAPVALPAAAHAATPCDGPTWVASWSASPQRASDSFRDQTLRMVVTPHATGSRLRVRLTNRFAARPVTFAAVHVGRRLKGAALVRGTNRRVTFGGRRRVTVAAGDEIVSDPVALATRPFRDLAVSIRVRGRTGPAPVHVRALETSYLTASGSPAQGAEVGGGAYTARTTSWYYLAGIDALSSGGGAIAALGDSITDGADSTPGTNRRWPDQLQRRLRADPALAGLSVVNAGIGGNQLTRDHPRFGPAGVRRARRDVFGLPGLRAVMVFEGTNDIAGNTPPRASAAELIAGLRELIAAARSRGLRVFGATLTPASGSRFPGHGDAYAIGVRREVNEWIRTSGAFDAVLDFEAALKDPSGAERIDPRYDSGDGLHPNDAGMRALARAVPLRALRSLACD